MQSDSKPKAPSTIPIQRAQMIVDLVSAMLLFDEVKKLRRVTGKPDLAVGIWNGEVAFYDYDADRSTAVVHGPDGSKVGQWSSKS